jgi:hypothetical protein
MEERILQHYRAFSTFTNPGCYRALLRALPNSVPELGELLAHQRIHRVTLRNGNSGPGADPRYGDMAQFPWYRLRCDDDVLMTSAAMIAELLRLDPRGFVRDRAVEHKLVVTCRHAAILMASILKAKGTPCRVRSGFAPYIVDGQSGDHWINQYWDATSGRWVTIDSDGFLDHVPFSQFDMPESCFDWAGPTWLRIRQGSLEGSRYSYADGRGTHGLKAVIRAVFYDFHCLMNNEISYNFQPRYIDGKFDELREETFLEIDKLAGLLCDPDRYFGALRRLWETEKKYRILNAPLIGDGDHVVWR